MMKKIDDFSRVQVTYQVLHMSRMINQDEVPAESCKCLEESTGALDMRSKDRGPPLLQKLFEYKKKRMEMYFRKEKVGCQVRHTIFASR